MEQQLRKLYSGITSFVNVQEDCAVPLLEASETHPMVKQLAAWGACGMQRSHVERDFWRLVDKGMPLDVIPFVTKIPYPRASGLGVEYKDHAFVLPHELFIVARATQDTDLYN